jgi:hypothetical protein
MIFADRMTESFVESHQILSNDLRSMMAGIRRGK